MSKRPRRILDDSDESSDEDAKKSRVINSDSDQTTDDDDEWNEDGNDKVKKKKKQKETKIESDSESDSDSSALEFNDGYDSELKGDEEDVESLENMTEKERETVLFERAERREAMRKRFEIEKKIRERSKTEKREKRRQKRLQNKKQETDSDSDTDSKEKTVSDPTDRRSTLAKSKNNDALNALKAEKQRKEDLKKRQEKKTIKVQDVFSSESESDDEGGKSLIRDSDESSDNDSNNGHHSDTEDPEETRKRTKITTKDHLKVAKVSRYRMAQWMHMPWFTKTVVGTYVRVNIGVGETPGKNTYRIAEIRDCSESPKVYKLDPGDTSSAKSSTNKQVLLRIGKLERNFRLCFISNNDWTDSEYTYWKKQVEQTGSLPTFGELELKRKKLDQAKGHIVTDKEIEEMVKQKTKHRSAPVNFATKKTTLIKMRDAAETEGNLDQVAEIQNELDRLEETANRLNRERQKDISGITYINDRIKATLRNKDKVCEEEWRIFREKRTLGVDPFTRRITMPILVSNTNAETKSQIKDVLSDRYTEDIDMHYESLVFTKAKKKEEKKENQANLYDAHDFDIDIDLNELPTPQMSSTFSSESSRTQSGSRLSLQDYKARNNM